MPKPLSHLSAKLRGKPAEMVQAVSIAAQQNIVLATPVDTGRARSNWTRESFSENYVELFNNLPYIQKLNEGHSKQAPAKFIELGIHQAVDNIK